jgi:dihydrofolate reductase/thymidylate synthase
MISAIVARGAFDGVIGHEGRIPWRVPEDLQFFKAKTMLNICIMGRKTYESLGPNLLPNRILFVVSREGLVKDDPRVRVFSSCHAALEEARKETPRKPVYICGGEQIYREMIDYCETVELTEIYRSTGPGDTFFHDDMLKEFVIDGRSGVRWSSEGQVPYEHVRYRRKSLVQHEEMNYLNVAREIQERGDIKSDRTGTGTISIFGPQLKFNLGTGEFPLLTTKKVYWKGVVEELLWFVRGCTDAKQLADKNVRIWDGNTSREFLDRRGLGEYEEGDIGPGYGFQWRHWGAEYKGCSADYRGLGTDQLSEAVRQIKEDPSSRRIIVSAWNVRDLNKMALPPCHLLFQFNVSPDSRLDLKVYQRSADWFLGVPFNIASYSLLLLMVCKVTGTHPGCLILTFGDAHIYKTHEAEIREQLSRPPLPFPKLVIREGKEYNTLEDFTAEDFELVGYRHHPPIHARMAV